MPPIQGGTRFFVHFKEGTIIVRISNTSSVGDRRHMIKALLPAPGHRWGGVL